MNKKYKLFFFATIFMYIFSMVITNLTLNNTEIINKMESQLDLSSGQSTVAIVMASIFSVFFLICFLIIARFLLILFLRLVYKNNLHKSFTNEIYFVAIGLKVALTSITLLILSSWEYRIMFTIILGLIFYSLFVYFRKSKINERTNKDIVIQLIAGLFLIIFI